MSEKKATEGVNCEKLARDHELPGGYIRNAVLRAAFVAAATDRPVDHRILEIAARIAMKQQGMLVKGSPHGDLWRHSHDM